MTDFPADPGCTSASAAFEFNLDADACGAGTMVAELPANGMASGTLGTGASNVRPRPAPARSAPAPRRRSRSWSSEPIDPGRDHQRAPAPPSTPSSTCAARAAPPRPSWRATTTSARPTTSRPLTAELEPGAYYLIVDAKAAGQMGTFPVQATFYAGRGETCTGAAQCAPGYECRTVTGGAAMTCERPVCSDGRDDDGDGKTDYPNDPGCTSATDATETDDCPSGAGCPACADGVDNDGDGQIDYPADTACASASGTTEYCVHHQDPVRPFTGNLTGRRRPPWPTTSTCRAAPTAATRSTRCDVTRPLVELHIDTIGSTTDTSVALEAGELRQPRPAVRRRRRRQRRLAGVPDRRRGRRVLHRRRRRQLARAPTTSTCAACWPTAAAAIRPRPSSRAASATPARARPASRPARRRPATTRSTTTATATATATRPIPGCASPSDPTEDDDCPSGTGCPACSNDVDDDGDGFIDYRADPGCAVGRHRQRAGAVHLDRSGRAPTNAALVGASTAGHTDDFALSCGFVDGRDDVYRLMRRRGRWRASRSTRSARRSTPCSRSATTAAAPPTWPATTMRAGNLDSRVTLTNVGVGEYFVIVDDRGAATPTTYNLNVTATVAAGAPCDPASTGHHLHRRLRVQGRRRDAPASSRRATTASTTTATARHRLPERPGLSSTSDDDEADDCPTGADLPGVQQRPGRRRRRPDRLRAGPVVRRRQRQQRAGAVHLDRPVPVFTDNLPA